MTQYTIDCTGNCVANDEVRFKRAKFTGSWRNAEFSHHEIVEGKITKESYGAKTGQHTFTIKLPNGKKTYIKGTNLYGSEGGVMRKPWADESKRLVALQEKYARGDAARAARCSRRGY